MNIYEQKQNMEEAFGVYLKKCFDIDKSESPYNDLSSIDACLQGKDIASLYDISTVEVFDEIIPYLEENGLYESRQEESLTERPQSYTDVLNHYRDFLVAYKFAQEWVKPRKPNSEEEMARNTIVFGAPGTGKSHCIKSFIKDKLATATDVTFHPDSDYASFVGCYKPTKSGNGDLTYEFVPQAFVNAYIEAWKLPKDKIHILRIEEINRGNCAQIFGDIFQLLDRYEEDSEEGTKGYSKYTVNTDTDLREYLRMTSFSSCDFSDIKDDEVREKVKNGEKLMLPSNLYILATMNTSDQSLYPMDSAFKRRWEWKYIPISYDKRVKFIVTDPKNKKGQGYSWEKFLEAINDKIFATTKSEDKQLGFWFTGESQVISLSTFVNKVVFYLWNDVFKDYQNNSNSPFGKNLTFQSFYDRNGNPLLNVVDDFMKTLDLTIQDDIYVHIEQSKQIAQSQNIKAKTSKFVVSYNGTIFNNPTAKYLFVEVINAIGPERIMALGRKIYNGTLITSNKEEFGDRDSVELEDGLYLLVNLSNKDKIKILNNIKDELHLNLSVNENPD